MQAGVSVPLGVAMPLSLLLTSLTEGLWSPLTPLSRVTPEDTEAGKGRELPEGTRA